MRVKKDKAYVVVCEQKGYVQGAFPYTEEGKESAQDYIKKLTAKEKRKFKLKVL
jgi:hypothetical protein